MTRGHKTEITNELIERVLRLHKKGVTTGTMQNLGVCNQYTARTILKQHGIDISRNHSGFNKSNRYPKRIDK